jgi:hypothetical protein
MDTFLFEADETSQVNKEEEADLLKLAAGGEIQAQKLYMSRLRVQHGEAQRLFDEGKVARVVYSGAKSLHLVVRVEPAPKTLDERRWLFAYLCKTLSPKLTFDSQVGDPTRLTRAPIEKKRITYAPDGTKIVDHQMKLFENWNNVYRFEWRPMYDAWRSQPKTRYEQTGKHLLPSRPIYRQAAESLLEGTYFTDKKWDGKRQETFFPAYRLVRALGYTFDQVWNEIDDQLKHYYKPEDVMYWTTRRDCKLIQEIENDLLE